MNGSSPEQFVLDLPTRAAMGREDFLVAPCNQDAVAWIDRWPDWPAPCLILFGSEGSGKTHLAHVWQAQADAMWAFNLGHPDWIEYLAGGRAVCFDINGSFADEEFMFHAYNAARAGGGTILLTGRTPASAWPLALPDLRSRLQAAPNVGLSPPDDALLAAVLVKLFADRQLEVEPNVLNYLLSRIERSFAAAGRIVADLDRAALAARRPVTIPLARQVLGQTPDA